MQTYIHGCIDTYIHTYRDISYIHTYINLWGLIHPPTQSGNSVHTITNAHIVHSYTHTYVRTYVHTYTGRPRHTYTISVWIHLQITKVCAHHHTQTQPHTHTCSLCLPQKHKSLYSPPHTYTNKTHPRTSRFYEYIHGVEGVFRTPVVKAEECGE